MTTIPSEYIIETMGGPAFMVPFACTSAIGFNVETVTYNNLKFQGNVCTYGAHYVS